jgi:3-octaprenyl-4-hydroxybenzoate carboxy-lyase C-terminal domain
MQAYKIMHGLWSMGQMMFTKYLVVVDDDVDVHNTSEVLFRLCANTDPQRACPPKLGEGGTASSPKARPTCSTTRPAKSPAAANSASTRQRKFRAKVSKDPGRAHQDGCGGETKDRHTIRERIVSWSFAGT